jgi:hypothetical protein
VIEPGERLNPGEFFAFEFAWRAESKGKPAQQNLIGLSVGLHSNTSIEPAGRRDLELCRALMFLDSDFTDIGSRSDRTLSRQHLSLPKPTRRFKLAKSARRSYTWPSRSDPGRHSQLLGRES